MTNDKNKAKGLDRLFGDMPEVSSQEASSPPEDTGTTAHRGRTRKEEYETRSLRVNKSTYEKMCYIAKATGRSIKDVYDSASRRFIKEYEEIDGREIVIRRKRQNKDFDKLFGDDE